LGKDADAWAEFERTWPRTRGVGVVPAPEEDLVGDGGRTVAAGKKKRVVAEAGRRLAAAEEVEEDPTAEREERNLGGAAGFEAEVEEIAEPVGLEDRGARDAWEL
jgi:hypothetical protein